MKTMKRALRRHHSTRLKRTRRHHFALGRGEGAHPVSLGIRVHTACTCSCWMCGNPRRKFGEVTRQEKLNSLEFAEQSYGFRRGFIEQG